jgi:3-hydroxyethyl bacteriochlorophyllide a dehydrogenase
MLIDTAQALVINGPNDISFTQIKLKEIGPEDVLVKTLYTSISAGTERMLVGGDLAAIANVPFPCVPGYETVGEIVEVGSAVPPNYVGELVYIGGSFGYVDVSSYWGGQSSYVSTHYSKAYLLNGLNPIDAVAIAPAATSWHGVELVDVKPGEIVLVMGGGPIGQLAAQAAKLKGAVVVLADKHQEKLDQAYGVDIKVNVSNTNLKDKLPGKIGVLIDATGKMDAIASNLILMQDKGRVLLLGFYRRIELDFVWAFLKELSFHASKEWAPEDVPAVIEAMRAGNIKTEYLFTHRFKIADYADAYAAALRNPHCLKALMEWE